MMENASPQQLAFYASLAISLFVSMLFEIFINVYHIDIHLFIRFNIFIFLFFFAYQVILFFIQKYIQYRFKLVYKNILKTKSDPSEKTNNIDFSANVFEKVESDVLSWMVNNQQQIQSLNELENYRKEFVGNVSHELNTPIFNIQGFLYTVLENQDMTNEKKIHYLTRAAKNADRLQKIVDDLQTISKFENGSQILEIQKFDMIDLTEEVIEELHYSSDEKQIKLTIENHSNRQIVVSADVERIRQVLVNLIANSIKYGIENGQTLIKYFDMETHFLIEVADNGIGIEEMHHKYLFDRFYRVDKGRSRSEGGTGLGLAIVKHILEVHKQNISIRSTVGKGSTFCFTLSKA